MAPQALTSVLGSVLPPSATSSLLSESTPASADPPSNSGVTFAVDEDPVYRYAVITSNSISVLACIIALSLYIFLRRKNPRLMSRTSLKISVAMATTDLLFHALNLGGYGKLPGGFTCAFVGGWFFDFLTMLSMFYACAIALNTQLVFVHRRTVKQSRQVLFLVVPGIAALLITVPPLIAGVFGFDEVFDYCWMNTYGLSAKTVLLRVLFASDLWLCLSFGYLSFAVLLICYTLFSSRSPMAGLGWQPRDRTSPRLPTHGATDALTSLAATLAWRNIARRALTIRVLGYVFVPVISIIPGVVLDILGRTSHTPAPEVVLIITSIIAGLMGTFNATLFSIDPSVLAVIYSPCVQRQSTIHSTVSHSPKARVLDGRGDTVELGQPKATNAGPLRGILVTTVRLTTTDYDNGMEDEGHFAVPNLPPSSQCSTLGYDAEKLADAYNDL